MQIVYISNRPEILNATLRKVSECMPFVTSVVACMPDPLLEMVSAPARLKLDLVSESSLLSHTQQSRLGSMDHQSRNYLIRNALITRDVIQDTFIMSDDDARPLKRIDLSYFESSNLHQPYYFHDLMAWNNNRTDFDAGQIATGALLNSLGLPTLSYASHMPQIIDRKLFLEAGTFFASYSGEFALCEWSSYFNYGALTHPERFNTPRPYSTLGWPEHPLAWAPLVKPIDYVFENYTPTLYARRGPFFSDTLPEQDQSSNSTPDQTKESVKKIIAWRQYVIDLKYPEQSRSKLKYLKLRTWVNKLLHNRGTRT